MKDAYVLRDIFFPVAENAKELTSKPQAVISYGSYLYNRSLDEPITNYDSVDELLEKTQDFIIVTDDMYGTLENIAKKLSWDQKTLDKQKRIQDKNSNTPIYYNLKSNEEFKFNLAGSQESGNPFMKIGFISREGYTDSMNPWGKNNIYLASRLSKPNNLLQFDPSFAETLETSTYESKEFFTWLAMTSLPREFDGKEFMMQYLKSSYTAEKYRSLVEKDKHLKILGAEFFDVQNNESKHMRTVLVKDLSDHVLFNSNPITDVKDVMDSEFFYTSKFENQYHKPLSQRFMMYVPYNITGLRATIKNSKSNKVAKQKSGFEYLNDKLKKKGKSKT